MGFLFGLAPSGVYHRHELLPVMRCALTAPFHPYRSANADLGGSLSAALSVGFRPPGVTWHSALWSPDFPPYSSRLEIQRLPSKLKSKGITRQLNNQEILAIKN